MTSKCLPIISSGVVQLQEGKWQPLLVSLTFFSTSLFLLSAQAAELHGQGDQDQVSTRSLSTVTDVSGAMSPAYTGGEGNRQQTSYCLRRNTPSVLIPASAGPDQGAAPGAAVTPQDSLSVVTGGETIRRPVTDTTECPEVGPSVSAFQSKGNMSKRDGSQRISPVQAEAPRKSKEKARTPTKRVYHLNRMWEGKSFLKSHGTPQREKREKQSSVKERGYGSLLQEYINLSFAQKKSRWVARFLSPPAFCWP